ncbi:MAG: sensor domain-containing diguanylate cyclase [Roseibium sp.]
MGWVFEDPLLLGLGSGLVGFLALYIVSRHYNLNVFGTDVSSETGKDNRILKLVVEHVHDGLLVQDIYGHIEWSNPAYSRITGFSAEEILGRRPQEFVLTDDNQLSDEDVANFRYDLNVIKSGFEERIQNRRKSGELFWNELIFAVFEGDTLKETKIIVISRDITHQIEHLDELETVRKRLKYKAEHDDLTEVANRSKLNKYLEHWLAEIREENGSIGVLHLDLDLFKDINDAYGHSAGDAVLVRVAEVVQSVVGKQGLVARVGGDEFVVAVPNPENSKALSELAGSVLQGISEPLLWEQLALNVAGSIGIMISDGSISTPSELINRADIALYEAKKSGQGQLAWYTDELGRAHRQKRKLASQAL